MGKGKLAKFADMPTNPLVIEPKVEVIPSKREFGFADCLTPDFTLRGRWHEEFFHNQNPIVLELGCGRGEYTVGLGKANPDVNYIGVDIKGARMWTGAREALSLGMKNVGFLRTNIEFIHQFFSPGEVSEIWLTFSDPQMKKPTKRLTSTWFLERYRRFVTDGGIIHLKTDSNFLFTYTEELLKYNRITPEISTRDLYGDQLPSPLQREASGLEAVRSIQTYYESMWRSRGIAIKYLSFHLDHTTPLREPAVDIPLDEYRSYAREKRSSLSVSR